MDEGTFWVRARAVAEEWFTVLVVAAVLLVAIGGWATATAYVAPGSVEEERTVRHWSVTGEFSHSATVTRENPLFPVGTDLSNRSTYYSRIAPVLDGQFIARYVGGGTGTVSANATLVVESVGENQVFWTERRRLNATTATAVETGETAVVAFDVNTTRVANRIDTIQSQLGGGSGTIQTSVVVDVTAAGEVNGQPAQLSFSRALSISLSGDTYTVSTPGATSKSMTTTRTVTVPRDRGLLWSVGGPLLLLVGGLALGGLGLGYRRDALGVTEAEREYLAFRDERDEFDEWVVRARLPNEVFDRPRAEAESLSDLVDFAIDTDTGVVEDPDDGTCYAVGEQFVLAYDPPEIGSQGRPDPLSGTDAEEEADSEAPDAEQRVGTVEESAVQDGSGGE
ncbi:MAG: DUF5305 family protein [Halobacterium sp.]